MSGGWQIHEHGSVSSTQDILKDMANKGAAEGNVVVAAEQTVGRGRHGRSWESQPGNLYLSLLLRPNCRAAQLGQISILAGLAVYQALGELVKDPKDLMLKWPNDVLLGGRKCAGILIETSLKSDVVEWVAVGIGVNINSAPENGVFLNGYTKREVSAESCRSFLLSYMGMHYLQWKTSGAFQGVRIAWMSGAHAKGEPVSVKIDKDLLEGDFHGIDEQGSLLLQTQGGEIKTITAGDVYL